MIRRDSIASGFSFALGVALLAGLLYVSWRIFGAALAVATPFVVAFAFTLLLDPVVDRIQARYARGKRGPAVLIVFLLFLLGFTGLIFLLVPQLIGQTGNLVSFFAPVTYTIERASSDNGRFAPVKDNLAATTYLDRGLTNGTPYVYRITAQDSGGNSYPLQQVIIAPRPTEVSEKREINTGSDKQEKSEKEKDEPTKGTGEAAQPKTATSTNTTAGLPPLANLTTVTATPGDGQVRLAWRPPAAAKSDFEKLREQVNTWLAAHRRMGPLQLPPSVEALQTQYADQIGQFFGQASRRLADVIVGSVSTLLTIVLIPILTFYLLSDIDRLRGRLLFLLPDQTRNHVIEVGSDIGEVFGNYVRGMLTVSSLYGLVGVGVFFACGLGSYAILLGFAAGLLYAIPFVGPLTTAILAAAVSLATHHGPQGTLIVLAATLAQNQIFDNLIVPRMIGHKVGLHPLITIFALFVGGDLFGIWGMLLSVPVAASIQVVLFKLFPKLTAPTPLALLMGQRAPRVEGPEEAQAHRADE